MLPCLVIVILLVAASFGVYFLVGNFIYPSDSEHFRIILDTNQTIFETDERFLSVALDTSFMKCLLHTLTERDWETLEELSSFLSPGYLRIGGTLADRVIFMRDGSNENNSKKCVDEPDDEALIITGEDWIKITNFAKKSGLNVVMDLNLLLRSGSTWNSTNAESLIKFSQEKGIPLDFQLGNEPNSFPHVFNLTVTGKQLARDFKQLRQLLNSNGYRNSKLIGPDVTRPTHLKTSSVSYLREFLENEDAVDVVSWHQYYLNGRNATVEDFINPETLDFLPPQIEAITKVVKESSKKLPIWISETSSAYGGGAHKISNRFAASFLWLDKLGVAARMGMSVVVRQSLFKDSYALINYNLTPSPDFWISFFYKNLVGRQVFSLKKAGDEEASKYLRFYCHCLSPNSRVDGTFVVFGLNLSNNTHLFVMSGVSVEYPIHSFVFRPEQGNLRSKSILLNQVKLIYKKSAMHALLNSSKEEQFPLVFPSLSIGFWVVKDMEGKMCK